MFAGKPIIGIAGGIGSGKSHVARVFGEMGCLVIAADDQVREAYASETVKRRLREWWGEGVFGADGSVNRAAVAERVFKDPAERERLEQLLHPIVSEGRDERMRQAAGDASVKAYVWDVPLLFEVGLNRECDAVVFVEAPLERRMERVAATRGWDGSELEKREKWQLPLDKKRVISDYIIRNASDADDIRGQVLEVLSRILAGLSTN